MEAFLNSPLGRTDLSSNVLTIGRAPDNQLVVQDSQASGHHAEIRPEGQGYAIVDKGSTNGTYVNEQRINPQVPWALNPGDVIRIGTTRFTYEVAGSYDATVRAAPTDFGSPAYPQQQSYTPYPQPAPPAPAYSPQEYQAYQQQPVVPPYQQQPWGAPPPQPVYPPPQPWGAPPAPGQFGPMPAQPPRRGRAGLIIGLVVLLLVILGGAFGALYITRSTPEKTLQAYCSALQNNDAHGAYVLLSSRVQNEENEQSFSQRFAATETALRNPVLGGLKSCTVSNVQENGNGASGVVTLAVNNAADTLPITITLVKESGGLFGTWKMDRATTPNPGQ